LGVRHPPSTHRGTHVIGWDGLKHISVCLRLCAVMLIHLAVCVRLRYVFYNYYISIFHT
jgi:hypothetical protein